MRTDDVAEFLLSLALPPERVAPAVGDLLEERPQRGAFWFWRSLAGLAGAGLGRTLAADPRQWLRLAFRGVLQAWFNAGLCGLLLVVLLVPRWVTADWAGQRYVQAAAMTVLWFAFAWARFSVGRYLADEARGRELAALLAFCVCEAALCLLLPAAIALLRGRPPMVWRLTGPPSDTVAYWLLMHPLLVAGALHRRFRRAEA